MSRQLVIFGAGGFGREVLQIVRDINRIEPGSWSVLGFVVDAEYQSTMRIHGLPILGGVDWLAKHPEVEVVIAIGAPAVRAHIAKRVSLEASNAFATLVHPRAWLGENVQLGPGSIICAGALLTTDIAIGSHVQVHIGATVGHDAALDEFVTVSPAVCISGHVRVAEGVEIGAGSVLVPKVEIGEWTIIGAGSVIIRPLPCNVTAVGSPAKVIRTRYPGWQEQ